MNVTVPCPGCQTPLSVDQQLLNRPVQCGGCAAVFIATGGGTGLAAAYQPDPRDSSAVAALVLGITSLVIGCVPLFGPVIALAGIALGIRGAGSPWRSGQAVAGIAMSVIGLLIGGFVTLVFVVAVNQPDF